MCTRFNTAHGTAGTRLVKAAPAEQGRKLPPRRLQAAGSATAAALEQHSLWKRWRGSKSALHIQAELQHRPGMSRRTAYFCCPLQRGLAAWLSGMQATFTYPHYSPKDKNDHILQHMHRFPCKILMWICSRTLEAANSRHMHHLLATRLRDTADWTDAVLNIVTVSHFVT